MALVPVKYINRKADIIARLQKEILPLQGLKSSVNGSALDMGLQLVKDAFPLGQFPLGAVHEFISSSAEDTAATTGFISALLSPILRKGGTSLWISSARNLFPPALKLFGIEPDRMIFIDLNNYKDVLWAIDESLKCSSLSAVIGELPELSFTASRRLQLAVEQSQVTAFILRRNPRNLQTTACVTRWKVTSLASDPVDDLPGLGHPHWNVDLMKVRNGKPGAWQVKWNAGHFELPLQNNIIEEQQLNTG